MMSTLASSFRQSLLRLISGSDSKDSPQRSLNELPQNIPVLSISYVPSPDGSESSNTLVNYSYNQSGDDSKSVDIVFEPARVPSPFIDQKRTLSTWLAHWIVDRPQVAAQPKNAVLHFAVLSDHINKVLIYVDPPCYTILVSLEYLDRILSITPLAGTMEGTLGLRTMYVLFLFALELALAREGVDSVISSEHWKPTPPESAARLREHYLGCLQTEFRLSADGGWLNRFENHANRILCDLHDSDILEDFCTARAEFESMRGDESIYGTPPSSPSLPPHRSPEDVLLRKEEDIRDFCATLDAITTTPLRESALLYTSSSSNIGSLDAQENVVEASGRVAEPISSLSDEAPLSPGILQHELSHTAHLPPSYVLTPSVIGSIIPVNDHVTPEMLNSVSVELSPLRAHLDRLTGLPSPQSLVNSLEDGVSLFQPAFPVDVEATRAYYDQQPLPLIVLGPPANSSNAGADIPPVQRPPTPSAGTLLASYEPRTLAASPSTPVEVPRWSEAYEGEEEGILIGEEEDISLVHDTPLQDRAEQGAVIWIPNRPPALSTLGHNPLPGSTDHHLVSYTGTVTGEVSALSTLGIIGHGSALGLILEKEFSFHCPRPIYGAQGFILMGEECFYDYRFDYFRPHFRPYWHENVWRS